MINSRLGFFWRKNKQDTHTASNPHNTKSDIQHIYSVYIQGQRFPVTLKLTQMLIPSQTFNISQGTPVVVGFFLSHSPSQPGRYYRLFHPPPSEGIQYTDFSNNNVPIHSFGTKVKP